MDYTSSSIQKNNSNHDAIIMPCLLFWQYLVVSFVLGIIATRFLDLALCAALLLSFLLYFVYMPKKKYRVSKHSLSLLQKSASAKSDLAVSTSPYFSLFLRIILCGICAITAYYYTLFISPNLNKEIQLKPTQTYAEQISFDTFNDPMQSIYIQGKIISTQSLPYGRLRFLLEEVKPLTGYLIQEDGQKIEAPPIPAILSLTWDRAPYFFTRPLVGQNIIAKTRIRETYGTMRDYWATKGVWYTAFVYKSEDIFWTGEAHFAQNARESLRHTFVNNLFAHPNRQNTENKASTEKENSLHTDLNNQETKEIETQAKAILSALLFGDRFYLSALSMDTFNSANLLHSLALSGQHLALTGVLAALLISLVLMFYPNILIHISRRRLIFYTSIPLALVYVFLGSAPLSLLRACIMFIIAGFCWIFARTVTLLDCLFFALAFFCLVEPLSIFDLGVQLSFTSVFTIAFCMPIIRIPTQIFQEKERERIKQTNAIRKILHDKHTVQKENSLKNASFLQNNSFQHYFDLICLFFQRISILCLRAICALFLVSLFIQITNLPIIITYFGKTSYFFLLNIIWLPILAFIILPFSAFALILTLLQLLVKSYFALPFLLDLIDMCTHICISIASYPIKYLLSFLLYLQNLGFDPFIQFYKPHKITLLLFYTLFLIILYAWMHYKQTKINQCHISLIKENNLPKARSSINFFQYYTGKITKLNCNQKVIFTLFLGFICITPYIYNTFYKEKHFTLSIFDVGQGQSVLIENTLKEDLDEFTQKSIGKALDNTNTTLKGRILIDAGGPKSPRFNVGRDIIAHKLTQGARPKLAYAIASHDDADHINGFAHIMQYFDVPALAQPYVKQTNISETRQNLDTILALKNIPIETLGMGDILDLGNGFALQVLHPPYPLANAKPIFIDINTKQANTSFQTLPISEVNEKNDVNEISEINTNYTRPLASPFKKYSSNNSSLVLRLIKDGKGLALICGDVEKDVLAELVKYEKQNMWTYNASSQYNIDKYATKNSLNLLNWSLKADVLILAHHGSINSYLPQFYELVQAHTVIASAGKFNRYGFPAQEIEAYFTKNPHQPTNFLVTARDGDITLKWQDNDLILQNSK